MAMKIPVREYALFRRINRHLAAADGRALRKARDGIKGALGNYYVTNGKNVVLKNVKLEQFGRELGVLRDDEKMVG